MKKYILTLLCCAGILCMNSQNPVSIITPSPTPNPPLLTSDTYTRATSSIKLQAGFKYGFITGTVATNLLNLNISGYPNYVNNNYNNPDETPGYYDANPDAVVGTTEGAANVSSTGSFQYNFPIKCSPGTAGMQPDLSISYNSNGANSWLGVGFNLTGISSINRTGKTAFYDGLNGGVNFNANDVFSLDGERLLVSNSVTYGQTGATYKLENENYELITSYGAQGSGPEYFIINTRDGRTIEYGKANGSNPANSRNTAKNSTEILNWCINKVTDRFGNYMTYNYINSDGEMLIDKIEYTGNGNFQPYNKISFTYINRSDNSSSFVAGKEFTRKKVLTRISCTDINNTVMRQYDLEYDYKFASFLNKITETDALGNTLNPTYIGWTKSQASTFQNVFTIAPNPQILLKTIAADMNGDGVQDLVFVQNPGGPTIEVKHSTGQTSFYANMIISSSPITILSTVVFDEDDDGKDEVFIMYTNNTASSYSVAKLKFNGTAYNVTTEINATNYPQNTTPHIWSALKVLNPHANSSGYFYGKEDVTGDDRRDEILVDQFNITITPSNGQAQVILPVTNLVKAELGDYNGDRIMEIYTLKYTNADNLFDVGIYAYDNTSNTLQLIATQQVDIGTNPNLAVWSSLSLSALLAVMENAAKSISFSDMDGDNKTDIFFINYSSNSGSAGFLRATGAGFIPAGNAITVPLTLNGSEAVFFTADVNNDGKSDMVVTSHNQAQKFTNYTWYPSNNNGLVGNGQIFNFFDEQVGVMGDFNGDGLLDYAYQWTENTTSRVTYSMFDQDNKRMVNHIFNIKNDYKINYKWLNSSNIYRKTTSTNSANFKVFMPHMFVVEGEGTNKNNEELNHYAYENGLLHEGKRGFLGFEKTYVYNANTWQSNAVYLGNITSYTFDPAYDCVTSAEVVTGYIQTNVTNTSPILPVTISSYSKNDLSYVATGTNRYLSSSETTQKDYLGSTQSHTTKTYDNANGGNILSSITEFKTWNGSSVIRSNKTDYTYATSGAAPITQLTKTKASSTANGSIAQNHTDYTYDAGHLKTKTENSNFPALAVTTTYDLFNMFGAPTTVNVTAPDLSASPPRAALMVYDNTGRFITKTTNAIGNSEEFTYEPGMGNKLSEKDISGLISTYTYDGMGRMLTAKLPNNSMNTFSYEWYNYPLSQYFSAYGTKVTSNIEGTGPSTTYTDLKDNTIKQETTGFNGATEITESAYDVLNRLTIRSEPHYQDQASYKSYTNTYDEYSRITKVSETINQGQANHVEYEFNTLSTNSQYNKGSVTTITKNSTGNGSSYLIKENNEAGQVDKIINYGGNSQQQTATYVFNEFNQPDVITTSFPNGTGDAVTKMFYDDLGRQKELNDPSSGITTYTYNSIGQLTAQVTHDGNYSYTYDVLGRMTQKSGSTQGTTYYSYVTAANGRQQLQTISGPEVVTDYMYDNLGRATEFKETLINTPNKVFKTNFTYDKYGRILNYKYPNGFVTTNEYNNAGMLIKIKNNSSVLWQLDAMHTPALPAQYSYTSGLSTTLAYDTQFNLKKINAGSLSKQTYAINNDNGDLLSREHINYTTGASNNESFNYDEFDRLTEVAYDDGNHNTTIRGTYSYEDNGNILHKTDCGDYVYGDPAKPYKLTQVDNPGPDVSLNTFNVTYNDLKKVSHLEDATAAKAFNFLYGNDENRIKMDYLISGHNQYTRFYQPNFDREESGGNYKEWCYVYAPTGLCAIYYKENNTGQTLHVTTDNLGSPVLLTDNNQGVVEENNFDPWGRRREPGNWDNFLTTNSSLLIRGFQMHEMLDEAGIINMNGRIYDPILGRFLQADIIIQEPDNLQNFNRYAYCFNNPLKYTDPSGYKNVTSPSQQVDWTNPSSVRSNIEPPRMYVDGMPITTGGPSYGFWGSGGAGSAGVTQNFGVWTGNGPGLRGAALSRGTLMDINEYTKPDYYAAASAKEYAQAYPELSGSSVGGGDILFEGGVNQAAVDAAQRGSGNFMDYAISAANFLNQFNPIANLMDVVSNAFYGTDRFGNKMSQGDAWMKAAGVIPFGKLGSTTNSMAHIFRDAAGHVNPTTIESQMRYMNLFSSVASDAKNLVPTINSAAAKAGVQTFNKTYKRGTVWVQTLNGQIRNAGVN